MKIAWFTPFNKQSAIGRYSKYAAEAIASLLDVRVDIFSFQPDGLYETHLEIIQFTQQDVAQKLAFYDLIIYNIGDYSPYHTPIFDVAREHRGIMIVHDVCLHNFFRGYYCVEKKNHLEYYRHLNRLYGKQDADMIVEAGNDFDKWSGLDFFKYNLVDLLAPYCDGMLVHSQYHKSIIENIYTGPIGILPLLYPAQQLQNPPDHRTAGNGADKLNILTVGNVNHNKRIHVVVETIGRSKLLKNNVCYTVIGSLANDAYIEQIRSLIKKHHLEKCVNLLGFVEPDRLSMAYHSADIISNLRLPAIEGGSASLVEQMLMGKSIIVSNVGVYAEMPDDCLHKIDPNNEIVEMTAILEQAVRDPVSIVNCGKNAKKYAESYFSESNYAALFHDFLERRNFLAPLDTLVQRIVDELNILNASPRMQILPRIAEALAIYAGPTQQAQRNVNDEKHKHEACKL